MGPGVACVSESWQHSVAFAELPSLGRAIGEWAVARCRLWSTSQAIARDTVERYAERLLREQFFRHSAGFLKLDAFMAGHRPLPEQLR